MNDRGRIALDAVLPHEPERSAAQVIAVMRLLAVPPRRVLDLGCGAGRLLVPIAQQGHHVTGIDHDATVLRACETNLQGHSHLNPTLIEADIATWLRQAKQVAAFDTILLLGNTLMCVHDLDEAIDLLAGLRRLLVAEGMLIVDDVPHDLWPELTEGNWTSGVSEDGSMQLIWSDHDAIFTIRTGNDVDSERWFLAEDDTRYRLWTSGTLSLVARLAGLSEPVRDAEGGLLVLRPAEDR